jgi:hypothetical protein
MTVADDDLLMKVAIKCQRKRKANRPLPEARPPAVGGNTGQEGALGGAPSAAAAQQSGTFTAGDRT